MYTLKPVFMYAAPLCERRKESWLSVLPGVAERCAFASSDISDDDGDDDCDDDESFVQYDVQTKEQTKG